MSLNDLFSLRWQLLAFAMCIAWGATASRVDAQSWRTDAAHVGTTARVLIVGARPDDEDNALIAWLSLTRRVETAYLSLTRGESGENVSGEERGAPLAVVRTAELLEERARDRARQYFTRAYDFGFTEDDSIVDRAWPHDSLVRDVVSIVRAFRPHVIVSLFSAVDEEDAVHRRAALLAAQAYTIAGDSARLSPAATGRLPVWSPSRLLTRVSSGSGSVLSINVGEFDRIAGRSAAEIGADIRRSQRTTAPSPNPDPGPLARLLRVDSARVAAGPSIFGALDTSFVRFRGVVPGAGASAFDSLMRDLGSRGPDETAELVAARMARVADLATRVRRELGCRDDSTIPTCRDALGDLAVALGTVRERAVRSMLGASGLVIDGTVERQFVGAGDSVRVDVMVYNGGAAPVTVRRLAAVSGNAPSVLLRDPIVVRPDSTVRRTGFARVLRETNHWWQVNGMVAGTFTHAIRPMSRGGPIGWLVMGEDRLASSSVEATVVIDGVEVPVIVKPLAERSGRTGRGDRMRPLLGVPKTSLVLDRFSEYVRSGLPWPRLFRVVVTSARETPDTVRVTLQVPAGVVADSMRRVVVLPPFGRRTLFFRLQGTLIPGSHKVAATAMSISNLADTARGVYRPEPIAEVRLGAVLRDFPHIPTQKFVRFAETRLEGVDLRVPAGMNVAYLRGREDIRSVFTQLQVKAQVVDASLLPLVDMSEFSTILVGHGALSGEGSAGTVPALLRYVRSGGKVVVLSDGDDPGVRELLPFPITFDTAKRQVVDPEAPVVLPTRLPGLIGRPNTITATDFDRWNGERARHVLLSADSRYEALLSIRLRENAPLRPVVLATRVGRGVIVHTSLSLAAQLEEAHPGAARLFVNLLAPLARPTAR